MNQTWKDNIFKRYRTKLDRQQFVFSLTNIFEINENGNQQKNDLDTKICYTSYNK